MICHQGVSEPAGAKAERFVPESGGGGAGQPASPGAAGEPAATRARG